MPTPPSAPRNMTPPARQAPPPSMGGGASSAAAAALDPARLLRTYYPWLLAAVAIGLVVGVASFFLLRRFAPQWSSQVSFEVTAPLSDPTDADSVAGGRASRDELERYMETQVLVINSEIILEEVAKDPTVKRDTKWAKQFMEAGGYNLAEAQDDLSDVVRARVVPDTSIIQISARTSEKEDAAIICQAVANKFLTRNRQEITGDIRQRQETLDRKVRDYRADVQALDVKIETLLGSNNITSLEMRNNEAFVELNVLQGTLVQTNDSLTQAEEQLQQYEQYLDSAQVPEAIREAAQGSAIAQQMEGSIAIEKAVLRALREEYGANHREVQRRESQLRAMEQERDIVVENARKELFATAIENLRTTVQTLKASQEGLVTRREELAKKLNELTILIKQHQDLTTERTLKMTQIEQFQAAVASMSLLMESGVRVDPLNNAAIPDMVAFPKLIPVVFVGVVLVVGLVGGVIVLKELREQRIRSPQDVSLIPRTRVVGIVPELALDPTRPERIETACIERPDGAVAESMRQIRTTLLKACHDRQHKAVLFVAGMPGSGTSSIIANLAANTAAVDLRVLIVDANLRRPTMHQLFGLPEGPGLGEALSGSAPFAEVVHGTPVPGLDLLPAGIDRRGSYERFTTNAMNDLLREARERYDLILIDAPPAVVSGDAVALAGKADASVLVVRAFTEKRGLVARLRNQLGDSKAEFLGVIVNAVRASAGGYFKRNFQATAAYQKQAAAPEPETVAIAASNGSPPDGEADDRS